MATSTTGGVAVPLLGCPLIKDGWDAMSEPKLTESASFCGSALPATLAGSSAASSTDRGWSPRRGIASGIRPVSWPRLRRAAIDGASPLKFHGTPVKAMMASGLEAFAGSSRRTDRTLTTPCGPPTKCSFVTSVRPTHTPACHELSPLQALGAGSRYKTVSANGTMSPL